ncbi:Actin-related protein 2 [Camellia lanceoleosa]|uniref:Actin-related protein 2 n=1 Tax=Camellia lanceoleosa TaxID=1840588 RepID=A0ACC0IK10_9ERIC|nr:Actin-related protein 2 [Camellia lanceoleosa]
MWFFSKTHPVKRRLFVTEVDTSPVQLSKDVNDLRSCDAQVVQNSLLFDADTSLEAVERWQGKAKRSKTTNSWKDLELNCSAKGGWHITSYLVDLLQRRGYAMNSTADFEIVRDVKENLCYLREYQLGLETTILVKNYTELNKIGAYPQTKCEPKVLVEFYKKRFLAQQ